jgi:integrating conjugative element protein (TIGR03755 family)
MIGTINLTKVTKITKKATKAYVFFVFSILFSHTAYADVTADKTLIPGDTGGMYYKIGGGDVTPLPYTGTGTDVNLDFSGNAGLGFDCDSFNPTVSIINSLNGLGDSYKNIEKNVFENMKGMLISEAGYLMAKAMPNLYKYARDGIGFGQFTYGLGLKSCNAMLSEVDEGKDPMNDWKQLAKRDSWKYHMSMASTQAAKSGMLGADGADVSQIKSKVEDDNGKSGMQWVQGVVRAGQKYAGGQGQPSIHLTKDTVIAGYNVLVGHGRTYDNTSPPQRDKDNQRLIDDFPDPKQAAQWMIKVVGEQEISTYPNGPKKSIPGIGLLNDVQAQSEAIKKKLVALIEGGDKMTVKNLKAVSPPKVMLNDAVIEMLRKQSSDLMRAIYVNKIANEVAVAKVLDKAKLGLQLLEVGRQVPAIFANSAAQKGIITEENRMKQWISDLRSNPKDNTEFVGGTIASLMSETNASEAASASIRPSARAVPPMEEGAIKTKK